MDLFRWHSESISAQAMKTGKIREATIEELADVVICALSFANRNGVDIARAVRSKLLKNSQKYPVRKYKGHSEAGTIRENRYLGRN
ncbi:MAG: MazG-like family protein [Nitrospira sp.]